MRKHFAIVLEAWREDRRRRAEAIKQEEPSFLPAALEILEAPPNPLGRIIIWAILAFLSIAVLWSIFGRVDIVAVAPGKVVPQGRVKIIQAADYGVIREISVREGERVRAGQPLITLDPTVTDADVEQAREALKGALVDSARARALVDYAAGLEPKFAPPEGLGAVAVATQEAFLAARVNEHSAAKAALVEELTKADADGVMLAEEIEKLRDQLALAEKRLEGLRTLEVEGYAPKLRVMEAEERVIGLRQDYAIRLAERRKSRASDVGLKENLRKLDAEFSREAFAALTEADAAVSIRSEELRKAAERNKLTQIVAPVAGSVQQIAVSTLGGVVKPADPLLVIVPEDVELMVEASVINRDAGFVRAGQKVEIKFEAYPFTRYGVIEGVLEHVSEDAVETEDEGLVYPARIKLLRDVLMIDGRKEKIAPGLSATAEIKTGERRIVEYLLSPLSRRVNEAGRER